MLTLLSLLGSGIVSIFPGVMQIMTRWMDTKKEIQLAQINAAIQEKSLETNKTLAVYTAATAEQSAVLANEASTVGAVTLWDGVRASVRPVITYAFVLLFIAAKITILYHLVVIKNTDIAIAIDRVWDETASTILAAVIAFWFGGRMLEKSGITPSKITKKSA